VLRSVRCDALSLVIGDHRLLLSESGLFAFSID